MKFITKNKFLNKINIEHDNKMILQTGFVKFWGITVERDSARRRLFLPANWT